jgi:putative transposase
MKMLDGVAELTLDLLNKATSAWMEIEYNHALHREISCSPVKRCKQAPDVLRASPKSKTLHDAFRLETKRTQCQSDGTILLDELCFDIAARYRHFRKVTVRYARCDLGRVHLVDERREMILASLYPLDKSANADGHRALFEPRGMDIPPDDSLPKDRELPPLLKKILQEYSATGMPPAYVPKTPPPTDRDLKTSQHGEEAS